MQGVAERYSTAARNRIRELRTQMIPLRLKQVRVASMQGLWQNEISLWEDLLILEPSGEDSASRLTVPLTIRGYTLYASTHDIQKRLEISQQNEQAAWMYKSAQQFIEKRDFATARTQLQMLWRDAPYYGDPAGLANKIGLPTALNYEQAIVAEQARLEQKRLERERQAREEQENQLAEKKRKERIASLLYIIGSITGGITGTIAGVLLQTIIGNAAGRLIGGVAGLIGGGIIGVVTGGITSDKASEDLHVPFAGDLIITVVGGIIGGILFGIAAGWIAAGIAGSIPGWVGVILGLIVGFLTGGFVASTVALILLMIVKGIVELIFKLGHKL